MKELLEWAEISDGSRDYMPAFVRGVEAAIASASRQHVGAHSILGVVSGEIRTDESALEGESTAAGKRAFAMGYKVTISMAILMASHRAPGARFFPLESVANGACLTNAAGDAIGGCPKELRGKVIDALARAWDLLCTVPGHQGRTHGQALAADHSRAFADADAYRRFMEQRDAAGSVAWSSRVEVYSVASVTQRITWVLAWYLGKVSRELAHGELVYPADGVVTGDPICVVHGVHGCGGSHFNCLLQVAVACT